MTDSPTHLEWPDDFEEANGTTTPTPRWEWRGSATPMDTDSE